MNCYSCDIHFYDVIEESRNLGNTVDCRKTSKKNAIYFSRDYYLSKLTPLYKNEQYERDIVQWRLLT